MNKKLKLSLLTIGIILLGFIRFYVFYNVNWILKTLTEGRMNSARKEFYFLLEWAPSSIILIKWLLTILFSLLFLGTTLWIIDTAFKSKTNNRLVVITYSVIIFTSAILYSIGMVFGFSLDIYGVIHTLMDIVQSFLPLMVFYVLFRFLGSASAEEY